MQESIRKEWRVKSSLGEELVCCPCPPPFFSPPISQLGRASESDPERLIYVLWALVNRSAGIWLTLRKPDREPGWNPSDGRAETGPQWSKLPFPHTGTIGFFSWGTEKPLSHLATELWSWGHPVGMWDDLCTKSRNALLAVEAVENHKQISWGWPQGTAFRVCKGGEPPDIWWARIQSTFGHLPHPGILTPGCTFDWQEILFWFFLSLLPYLYLTLERPEMVGGGREVKQNQVQIVHAPTALWCRVFVVVVVVVLLCLFFAWDRPKLGSGELDIEWGFKL